MKHLLVFGVAFATFYICHSEISEICKLPFDEGNGPTVTIYTYYDATKDLCNPFRYTGAGGNANRFTNEKACMRNCSANAEELYPMDETEACHFPKKQGECLGQYLRFYYDSIHHKCKKFIWTGCVGNGNRFLDHKSCNDTCAGIHDDGDGEDEDEPDTPVALICGIVFGVVGAIIIIVVVVLTVQSGNDSKKVSKKTKDPKTSLPLQDKATEIP